ncbi:hypothetical protein [Mesorhizobium sp. M0016]
MSYLLTAWLFGQVFVLDSGLTKEDCEAYRPAGVVQCVVDVGA